MAFTLTTAGSSTVSLADNRVVPVGGSLVADYVDTSIAAAVAAGYINCSPAIPTTAALTTTSAVLVNSTTGTAPSAATGTLTFAAVTDFPSTANAIAGLIAQLKLVQADLAAATAYSQGQNAELEYLRERARTYGNGYFTTASVANPNGAVQ